VGEPGKLTIACVRCPVRRDNVERVNVVSDVLYTMGVETASVICEHDDIFMSLDSGVIKNNVVVCAARGEDLIVRS
jgi:hypothetical protein